MSQRWLIVGLIVSGAVNLFLIGAAVGVILLGARMRQEHGPGGPAPVRPGQELMRAAQVLPPEQARHFRQALRREVMTGGPAAREGRRLRMETFRAAATSPTFDAAAVKAALARARTSDITARGKVEDAMIDFAATLPTAERQALFDALSRPPAPPRDGRGPGTGPGMGPGPYPPGPPEAGPPSPEAGPPN